MVFVLLEKRMEPKSGKPSLLFASPFSLWTEYAFKLWGFGKTAERPDATEKPVTVAVIPTRDGQSLSPAKAARAHSTPKPAKRNTSGKAGKGRRKSRSKRAGR